MESIQDFYPGLLDKLRGEAYADAISNVEFAWASEKQQELVD